jgi:hypothetical protein
LPTFVIVADRLLSSRPTPWPSARGKLDSITRRKRHRLTKAPKRRLCGETALRSDA